LLVSDGLLVMDLVQMESSLTKTLLVQSLMSLHNRLATRLRYIDISMQLTFARTGHSMLTMIDACSHGIFSLLRCLL